MHLSASVLLLSLTEQTGGHGFSLHLHLQFIHLTPPLSALLYPLCEFCYYTVLDLFILPITALLFPLHPSFCIIFSISSRDAPLELSILLSAEGWDVRLEVKPVTLTASSLPFAFDCETKQNKASSRPQTSSTASRFNKWISTLQHECAASTVQ